MILRPSRRQFTLGAFASAAFASTSLAQSSQSAPQPTGSPEKRNASMLTVTEQLMHSTIMIRCKDSKGNLSSGTGFIFHLFNFQGQNVPVLVTNKHVVRDAADGMLVFTEANADGSPNYGANLPIVISEFAKGWIDHPDAGVDLTIFPIAGILKQFIDQGKRPFTVGIDETIIPTEQGFRDLTPMEDVLIIGYPDGISDTKNNVPVFRRGITATPVYLDFSGKKEFLVDAAIFPGSSGSPVFLFNQGTWHNRDGSTAVGNRIQLLGIIYAVALHTTDGEIIIVPAPTQAKSMAKSQIPNNLGLCIRASRVLEFEPIVVQKGFNVPDGYKMRAG